MKTHAFMAFMILAIIGFIFIGPSFGEQSGCIILTDGSKVYGTILTLDNGTYKIESDSLGTIQIPESKIASFNFESSNFESNSGTNNYKSASSTKIPSQPAVAAATPNTVDPAIISNISNQILSNERLLGLLLSLGNNPEIQSIINNPNLKRAIDTGDINTLLKSPEIQKLMNNETVQEIQRNVGAN